MKKLFIALAVIIFSSFDASCAHALDSYTATGSASVTLARPLSVSQTRDLNFGTIEIADNADTISLDFDNVINSVNGSSNIGGAPSPAQFSAAGQPNTAFAITISNTSLTGSGQPIPLNNLQHDAGDNPRFDGSGISIFNVVGELQTNANQAPGAYTGQYQVVVNYP